MAGLSEKGGLTRQAGAPFLWQHLSLGMLEKGVIATTTEVRVRRPEQKKHAFTHTVEDPVPLPRCLRGIKVHTRAGAPVPLPTEFALEASRSIRE